MHLVRYGGCLAPHSHLRGAMIPTPCQQGVEEQEDSTASPRWRWARLLKRVFALAMARCPWCQRGALRIIASIVGPVCESLSSSGWGFSAFRWIRRRTAVVSDPVSALSVIG